MNLPKLNGHVDTEMVSDMVVTYILAKCEIRIDNQVKHELENWTEKLIKEIIKEATNQ